MSQANSKPLQLVDMTDKSTVDHFEKMVLGLTPVRGMVQPPVQPAPAKPTGNTKSLQYMHKVLKTILKHKYAWPFHHPVNAKELNLRDYHTLTKYPMDLGTIEMRLQNSFYTSVHECIEDFRLMFYNCYKYNKPDQDIVIMAKTIEKLFISKMDDCPAEETEVHTAGELRQKNRRKRKIGGLEHEEIDVQTIEEGRAEDHMKRKTDNLNHDDYEDQKTEDSPRVNRTKINLSDLKHEAERALQIVMSLKEKELQKMRDRRMRIRDFETEDDAVSVSAAHELRREGESHVCEVKDNEDLSDAEIDSNKENQSDENFDENKMSENKDDEEERIEDVFVSYCQRLMLKESIQELPEEGLRQVVLLLKQYEPAYQDLTIGEWEEELHVDFDSLRAKTLRELKKFLRWREKLYKIKRKRF